MATATFDTLKFANTLKAAGVPEKQAEAQAAAFGEALQVNFRELATKDDLKSLRDELKHEIKTSVDTLRQEMKLSFDSIRQELKTSNDGIRQEFKTSNDANRQDLKISNDTLRQEMRSSNDNLRHEIKESEQRFKNSIDLLRAEIVLLKWMIGVVGFGILSLVIRVFAIRGGI